MTEKDLLPLSIGMCVSSDSNYSYDTTKNNLELLEKIKQSVNDGKFELTDKEKQFYISICDESITILTKELGKYNESIGNP